MMTVFDLLDDGGELTAQSFSQTHTEDLADLVGCQPPQSQLTGAFEYLVDGKVAPKDEVSAVLDLSDGLETRQIHLLAFALGEFEPRIRVQYSSRLRMSSGWSRSVAACNWATLSTARRAFSFLRKPIFFPGKIPVSAFTIRSKSKGRTNGGGKARPSISSVPHFSLEKLTYQQQTKTVLYRSKMNPVLKKNFAVFPVLDWIATLTTHIPNKGEQLVRYYGYYSNVSRGIQSRSWQ